MRLGPALAQEGAGVQGAPGAGTLAPAAAALAVTVTVIVALPEGAMEPPEKLQVSRAPASLQLQLVPVAETKVRFAGSRSFTCALLAARAPELVTVSV